MERGETEEIAVILCRSIGNASTWCFTSVLHFCCASIPLERVQVTGSKWDINWMDSLRY